MLEESEEVKFELDGEIFAEEGGEAEVEHRSTAGPSVKAGGAVEVVVLD